MNKTRLWKFLIIGVLIGLTEDLLAISFATDAQITLRVFLIVFLIAVPFAFVTEFVVRHPSLWRWVRGKERKKAAS